MYDVHKSSDVDRSYSLTFAEHFKDQTLEPNIIITYICQVIQIYVEILENNTVCTYVNIFTAKNTYLCSFCAGNGLCVLTLYKAETVWKPLN